MQEVIVRALGGDLALRLYRERCQGNPSRRARRSLTTPPVHRRGRGTPPAHGTRRAGAADDQLLDRGGGVAGLKRHLLGQGIEGAEGPGEVPAPTQLSRPVRENQK